MVGGAQVLLRNKWCMICSSLWQRPEVRARHIAFRLYEVSWSDQNDLQGDGHASIAEHGVEDCHDWECIFDRNSGVDHWETVHFGSD